MYKSPLNGKWWKNATTLLDAQIKSCFEDERGPGALPVPSQEPLAGVVVPYGPYDITGPCMAWSYTKLVEAGVPFVTLYYGGWDHHTNLFRSLDKKLPPLDATIAALINDLDSRGLLDTTLVVMLGEFGRTPKINKDGARDHWSNAMSVMFAGGHTPGGQVIGATDRQGYAAVERVLSPENFVSTIYRKLGIDPGQVMYTPEGRPTHLVSDATPISELMG